MASFTQIGKALKDRRSAWSLASAVIRHGSGSRNTGRDVNPTVKSVRSDMISCASSSSSNTMPVSSSSGHIRFLPATTARHCDASVSGKKQLNELSAAGIVNNNNTEKVGQALLYGRRRKRSSETIRHDKLYLQTSDFSKREYVQTWNDFQDKRSIPTTEWGKRHSDD